jgi:hypothetical protein
MTKWASDKQQVWEKVCEKYGGNKEAFEWGTWGFFDWAIGKGWPTLASVSKARRMGWTRYDDTYETWIETFRTFESAGVLPPHRNLLVDTSVAAAPAKIAIGTKSQDITSSIVNGTSKQTPTAQHVEVIDTEHNEQSTPTIAAA